MSLSSGSDGVQDNVGPIAYKSGVRWHVLTGEYPPDSGGVSDYTAIVARKLAADGDSVSVYVPGFGPVVWDCGVRIIRLPRGFTPGGLPTLGRLLASEPPPDRILIQYSPHNFGLKGMNVPFAVWVKLRAARIAPVWVMFHEVAFPFVRRPLRHNLIAISNRVMARLVAGAAERVFVSIPSWGLMLKRICSYVSRPEWLPVPCNVAMTSGPIRVSETRALYVSDRESMLIGHFGTFGSLVTDLLEPIIVEVLRIRPSFRFLLMGRNSEVYCRRLAAKHSDIAGRIIATGALSASAVADHLRACDVLLQPYPDGVSSRRGSAMAGLANSVPLVTNLGPLSESLWTNAAGVIVVDDWDPATFAAAAAAVLALPSSGRRDLGSRGAALYEATFAIERTIARLRDSQIMSDCK